MCTHICNTHLVCAVVQWAHCRFLWYGARIGDDTAPLTPLRCTCTAVSCLCDITSSAFLLTVFGDRLLANGLEAVERFNLLINT